VYKGKTARAPAVNTRRCVRIDVGRAHPRRPCVHVHAGGRCARRCRWAGCQRGALEGARAGVRAAGGQNRGVPLLARAGRWALQRKGARAQVAAPAASRAPAGCCTAPQPRNATPRPPLAWSGGRRRRPGPRRRRPPRTSSPTLGSHTLRPVWPFPKRPNQSRAARGRMGGTSRQHHDTALVPAQRLPLRAQRGASLQLCVPLQSTLLVPSSGIPPCAAPQKTAVSRRVHPSTVCHRPQTRQS